MVSKGLIFFTLFGIFLISSLANAQTEKDHTLKLVEKQEKFGSGQNSPIESRQQYLLIGRQRAEQMVNMLKDQELQKAMVAVNEKGMQILRRNKFLESPAIVVASMAALWTGRSARIFRGESYEVTGMIEARSRRSEFSMQSPLLNGRLQFSTSDGIGVTMNRSIASIRTHAELEYRIQQRTLSTRMSHRIIDHLDLSFGASQIPNTGRWDQNAQINYNISF